MTNLEKITALYKLGITKDEVLEYVKNNKISEEDYKTITGEDCPTLELTDVINRKVQELEYKCGSILNAGFDSDCLGTTKHFSSDSTSIGFIQGLAAKASLIANGADIKDKNLDWKAANEPICYTFTPAQMIALGVDLSTFMTSNIKKKEQLQDYVRSLTDINAIKAITWDTEIPSK